MATPFLTYMTKQTTEKIWEQIQAVLLWHTVY